ncbi:50S ribosomal protein L3 [Patescibacteria group bacterium]|nr:50S ribosomal protein L3 [Patescibacteria group bacterium]
MTKFILGKKLEMSQIFEDGKVVPLTLITAGPCFVTQVKKKERDGYSALQIGFEKLKPKKVKKPEKEKPFRYLKEFKNKIEEYKIGQKIDVSIFKEGDRVKISGISKGKGFAGAVKRWGFSGRGATHGVKHEHRTLGSVGSTDAERVFKGKKMPGRMGAERITVSNLEIVKVDPENNLMAVKGAIPGRRGTLLEIKSEN